MIFLFNIGGYHIVFWGLRIQAKKDLLHRLDADAYSSEDVVVLTVPISLPYPVYDAEYQSASGAVEHNGEFYQIVKQKVDNNTLYIICVKDPHQKRIARSMNEYTKLANNLPASTKHTMDLLGKMFKDFTTESFTAPAKELILKYDIVFATGNFLMEQSGHPVDSPPPKLS